MNLTYVSYDLSLFSPEMDKKITDALGLKTFGSGAGFGMRDLEFETKLSVSTIQRKLKAAGINAVVSGGR